MNMNVPSRSERIAAIQRDESPRMSSTVGLPPTRFSCRVAPLLNGSVGNDALEAAVELVSLFVVSPEQRLVTVPHLAGPVLEKVVSAAWQAVVHIEVRHRTARERRYKITIRTEPGSLEVLREGLEDQRFSLNAALASVFTPWGSEWGDSAAYQLRLDLWAWAAERARARDYLRRRGARGTASGTSDMKSHGSASVRRAEGRAVGLVALSAG